MWMGYAFLAQYKLAPQYKHLFVLNGEILNVKYSNMYRQRVMQCIDCNVPYIFGIVMMLA